MSNGFAMSRLPNEDVVQIAVERGAQAGEGVEVHVTRGARIEAIDEVLRHARFLRQFARGYALAC